MASILTKVIANFSTQITSNVSVAGVTASLASNLDKEGNILPTGVYCFTLNQGKSNEQHFLCDLTGTAITNVKGVTHAGVQSVGFLKDARINDEIKLTNYINLLSLVLLASGAAGFDAGTPLKYDGAPALTDPRQIPDKAYTDSALAGKADKTGNNNFSGNNSFSISPTVPDATTSNQPVTLAQLMAAALVGIAAGFDNVDISYDLSDRPISVHDNVNGKTYVFEYDENGYISAIFDGTKRTRMTIVNGRFISKATN